MLPAEVLLSSSALSGSHLLLQSVKELFYPRVVFALSRVTEVTTKWKALNSSFAVICLPSGRWIWKCSTFRQVWKYSTGLTAGALEGFKLCCRTRLCVTHFRLGSKDFLKTQIINSFPDKDTEFVSSFRGAAILRSVVQKDKTVAGFCVHFLLNWRFVSNWKESKRICRTPDSLISLCVLVVPAAALLYPAVGKT